MRKHLTFANTVATLALFLSLGGTAIAGKQYLTGKDIKDHSLTGIDVRNSTLTGKDIKSNTISSGDISE